MKSVSWSYCPQDDTIYTPTLSSVRKDLFRLSLYHSQPRSSPDCRACTTFLLGNCGSHPVFNDQFRSPLASPLIYYQRSKLPSVVRSNPSASIGCVAGLSSDEHTILTIPPQFLVGSITFLSAQWVSLSSSTWNLVVFLLRKGWDEVYEEWGI
ncbi:unnamed protein product [Linum trigynum]|uniref:Uncharacterized protein n=1 Tax=Linum trigynum TaxID=586398 RepID=A0AAV2CEH3_9ROSI